MLARAERERVLLPAAAALGDDRLPAAAREQVERRRRSHRELALLVDELDSTLTEVVFCKGPAVEAAYPAGYLRQQNDVDAAVRDADAFWAAGEVLLRAGFVPGLLSLRRDGSPGGWSGSGIFWRESAADDGAWCKLDLAFGALPLHWQTALPLDAAFWETRRGRFPSWRHSALIQVGELLERSRLLVRDELDLAALLGRLDPGDRAWFADRTRALGLDWELRRLRGRAPLPGRPLRVSLGHSLPLARRERRAAAPAVARSLTREVVGALSNRGLARPIERLGSLPDARALVERGVYVPFVPLSTDGARPLAWSGRLLVTPLGSFLPAPLGVVPQRAVDEARRSLAGAA